MTVSKHSANPINLKALLKEVLQDLPEGEMTELLGGASPYERQEFFPIQK